MGKKKPQQRVTEYRLGLHYGLCVGPIDFVSKIEINDKVAYHDRTDGTNTDYIDINLPGLFGGIKKEGGVKGRVTIGYGWDWWWTPEFNAAKLGRTTATMTGYQGTATAWFTETPGNRAGFYWSANSPYVPAAVITASRSSFELFNNTNVLWRFAEENLIEATHNPLRQGSTSSRYPWWNQNDSTFSQGNAFPVIGHSDPFGDTKAFTLRDNKTLYAQSAWQWILGTPGAGRVPENYSYTYFYNNRIVGSVYIKRDQALSCFSGIRVHNAFFAYNHQTDLIDFTLTQGPAPAAFAVSGYGIEVIDTDWRRIWVDISGSQMSITGMWYIQLYPAYGLASNFPTQDDTATGTVTFFGPMVYRAVNPDYSPALAIPTPQPYVENLGSKSWFADLGFLNFSGSTAANQLVGVPVFDSNPADIIYECLVNTDWGMGSPTSGVDTATFLAASQTLFDENFGLSFLWTQQTEIESFVGEVLDHIEAVLFVSPLTGQLTLKLIRDDYDVNSLPIFTPDNSMVKKFGRKLYGETINEIVVTYTDPETEEPLTTIAQDLGNISMQGGIVSDTRNYYGVHNKVLAATLAQRDLRSAATPLASCEIEVNREAWNLLPGDVVKLNSPEDQIASLIMRVGPVDYGKPGDPTVRASLVEDIFSLGLSEFTVPPDNIINEPDVEPTVADFSLIMTLPYFMAVNMAEVGQIDGLAYPEVIVGVLAGEDGSSEFDLVGDTTDAAGNPITDVIGTKTIAAHATLSEIFPQEASTSVAPFPDVTQGSGPVIGGFMLIEAADTVSGNVHEENSELCLITGFAAGEFTYARGVLDTVPRQWPAGTPVWFIDQSMFFADPEIHSDAEYVTYKILPRTPLGILDEADAPDISETLTGRPWLPLRPANVLVNSQAFGVVEVVGVDPIPVTWSRRNRETENAIVLAWDDADVTPETAQVTIVYLTDLAGGVLHTYADNSGTSQNVAVADFAGETEGFIVVKSSFTGSGALESLQEYAVEIRMFTQGAGTVTITVGMTANATIV